MATRAEVVAEARTWIGAPWIDKGRTRHGIDCAGLPIMVAHALGLSDFDVRTYPRTGRAHLFLEQFRENTDLKPVDEMKPGDMLTFRQGIYSCHCAIVSEREYDRGRLVLSIIHAHELRRRVMEEPIDDYWRGIVTGCFAYRGIED